MYAINLKIDEKQKSEILALLVPCKFCKQHCANIECFAPPPTESGDSISVHIWCNCEECEHEAEIDSDVQADGFHDAVAEWNRFHSDPSATYWKS